MTNAEKRVRELYVLARSLRQRTCDQEGVADGEIKARLGDAGAYLSLAADCLREVAEALKEDAEAE